MLLDLKELLLRYSKLKNNLKRLSDGSHSGQKENIDILEIMRNHTAKLKALKYKLAQNVESKLENLEQQRQ